MRNESDNRWAEPISADGTLPVSEDKMTKCGALRKADFVPAVHVLHRGDLKRPKERVSPGIPAVLSKAVRCDDSLPGPYGSRKKLALWLTTEGGEKSRV